MSATDRVRAEARELLKGVRARLDKRESWTQGTPARTHRGGIVLPSKSPLATCWCLTGAVTREAHDRDMAGLVYQTVIAWVCQTIHERYGTTANRYQKAHRVQVWNDAGGREHRDVLMILDATIKREVMS